MDLRASIAAIRFGLGRRPDDPVPGDPVAWLDRQVTTPGPQRPLPGLPAPLTSADAAALFQARMSAGRGENAAAKRSIRNASGVDGAVWIAHCLVSEAPLQDRLTNFWANHFTISRRVANAGMFIGPFIREAIRPNLFGRYEDLLLAAMRQPGMIIYLSNGRSTGPNSEAAMRAAGGTRRGLNENLAREILELHTLSPAGGYTQEDVTSFARILTGWRYERNDGGAPFRFSDRQHEPGDKMLLGRRFPEGEQGAVEALRFLARHPATQRHIATKLVRHFVADDPPREAVARIEAVFRDTGGDLGAVTRALIRLPQAWAPPLSKVRAPLDYALAVGRGLGFAPDQAEWLVQAMEDCGQPLWRAPQPNGWPDIADEWAQPEALLHRIQWAHAVAGRVAQRRDPRGFAEATLGPLASPEMLREAARAGSAQDAYTLVLVSPEYQRR